MFCREQVARIVEHKDEIEALGGHIVAIGNGSADHARDFLRRESAAIELYVDPSRATFKSFDMKRGPITVTGPKTIAHAARATAAGFRQSATRGSVTQIGGVIVFAADGNVLYEHIESEAGDIADYEAVVNALR
jgi:peroxiredoxin